MQTTPSALERTGKTSLVNLTLLEDKNYDQNSLRLSHYHEYVMPLSNLTLVSFFCNFFIDAKHTKAC
jgi:hypothetical protein